MSTHDDPSTADRDTVTDSDGPQRDPRSLRVAELGFVLFLLLLTLGALAESMTYSLTAARTPLVILLPMLVLVLFLAWREIVAARTDVHDLVADIKAAFAGEYPKFNQFVRFTGWLVALILMVAVLGHYVAVGLFTYLLMRPVGGESRSLSLKIAIAMPVAIFLIFDVALGLRMFSGIFYQLWAGYDLF